jgi:hypothetical protein
MPGSSPAHRRLETGLPGLKLAYLRVIISPLGEMVTFIFRSREDHHAAPHCILGRHLMLRVL